MSNSLGGNRIHAAALRYFDAVRKAGTIREAARRLHVASSAVNRQILGLEAQIGTPLFDRTISGLKLTASGEILAEHVMTVFRDAERAQSQLDALRGLRAGHVELATLEGLCHRIVAEAVTSFQSKYPRVTIGVSILGTSSIPAAVADGSADIGMAFEVRRTPELRQLAMLRVPLGAIVHPHSPLRSFETVTMEDCKPYPIIMPKANFANRAQLQAALGQAGISRGSIEAGSIELMKRLVRNGCGIAFMTRIGIETELEDGSLCHVPLRHNKNAILSELGLYVSDRVPLSVAAAAFSHHLAETLYDAPSAPA